MKPRTTTVKRLLYGVCITIFAGVILSSPWSYAIEFCEPQAGTTERHSDRFDMLVRDDFFAGMMGDTVRLERGMMVCEDVLAKNPKHAEALVWHGGGLIARGQRAYTAGDAALGDRLWSAGIDEMNKAVTFEPENMGVKIGRAATLIGLAQSGWDSSDNGSRALLKSAVLDYEKVLRWHGPLFDRVSDHSRGELLFGLASGWSILRDQKKTREYLSLILRKCKNTTYESEARRWLNKKRPVVVQHDCTGCHISSSE
jgi:hypothetical protein